MAVTGAWANEKAGAELRLNTVETGADESDFETGTGVGVIAAEAGAIFDNDASTGAAVSDAGYMRFGVVAIGLFPKLKREVLGPFESGTLTFSGTNPNFISTFGFSGSFDAFGMFVTFR